MKNMRSVNLRIKGINMFCALFALCLCFSEASSQIIVNGHVYDDAGLALIGANVFEKGEMNGTITDIDGAFQIELSDSTNVKLAVSFIGYETREISVNSIGKELSIYMNSGESLEEVIVVGYASAIHKRKSFSRKASPAARHNFSIYNNTDGANYDAEEYGLIKENTFKNPKVDALSTFSTDVDGAAYSNVRRFINMGQKPPKDAVRVEEFVNYFNYNYSEPKGVDPLVIHTSYTDCPWNNEHQLLHVAMQAQKINTNDLPPTNLVFLIDVSGSMSNGNKLPLVKSSLKLLVKQMRQDDRISIVTYAGRAGVLLESTSGARKNVIMDAIESLGAGGSTAGAQGILTAYSIAESNFITEGNNRIILATDGDFNVGVNSSVDLERLIEKKRDGNIFLSVLGYGMGNYKDDQMQVLANKGNGVHSYIDSYQEAKKIFVEEFLGTIYTLAKDVKLQLEFNPKYLQAYRLIGYENRLLENEDFDDDKIDAGEIGSGHTVTQPFMN